MASDSETDGGSPKPRMLQVPEGIFPHPGGVLLIKHAVATGGTIIRFVPRAEGFPEKITGLDWYWYDGDFDGTSTAFGNGLSEEDMDKLPPEYRYES